MDVSKIRIGGQSSVVEAIAAIDHVGAGVAAVVGPNGKLIGIITDGDIRRAILQNFDLSRSVVELQKCLPHEFGPKPLSLPVGSTRAEMIAFFEHYKIRHLPLVDAEGRLIALVTHEELLGPSVSQSRGVIMAGGAGMRLRPLTESVPKPMLELRGKPILLRLIEQFRQHGVTNITLVLYYKKELIQEFFGDGTQWGVNIEYVVESEACGTAGAISHITLDHRSLLIANGDIVTTVNFEMMEHFHNQNGASLTMGVVAYPVIIPYGVVEMQESRVVSIIEKPQTHHFVNAGIYLVSPELCRLIPRKGIYNMTDLVSDAMAGGWRVLGFPVREYWRDIGQHDDFRQAELELTQQRPGA
jgi:dTDP-glucose pyrophosphorylase/CBS domain-containing protein